MKIKIPEFKAMAKCNEHLNHGPIEIDLGPDVVQVVRCRDCTFALDYDPTNDNVPLTESLWCDYWIDGVKKDGYCFRGERREEG